MPCRANRGKAAGTGVARGVVQLLLDAQQLVVLRHPLAAGRRAGLDLAAVGGDGEVGDRGVLGLAGAVAHHAAVAGCGAPASTASRVSVSVPIWLTFTSSALAALLGDAVGRAASGW